MRHFGNNNNQIHWKISILGNDRSSILFQKCFSSIREATDFFGFGTVDTLTHIYKGRIKGTKRACIRYASFRIEKIKQNDDDNNCEKEVSVGVECGG